MSRRTLLIEDETVLNSLGKIVNSLSHEPSGRDDLMQEGLIHLWRSEQERPGQSTSWYLQGCRFRLQHYLGAGRSLDSGKRRRRQVMHAGDEKPLTELFEELQTPETEFGEVSARDMMQTISVGLKPRERAVLHCLADGLPNAEIVRRLRLSSPTVAKYRRKIATVAEKLGMATLVVTR